jgi:hypothetical protein
VKDYYAPSDWNVVCAVCGFKHKASQTKERWDGQRVCEKDFETRHPLDLIRAVPREETKLPFSRPPPTPIYLYTISILYDQNLQPILDENNSELRG